MKRKYLIFIIPLWAFVAFFACQHLLALILRFILPNNVLSMPITQSIYSIIADLLSLAVTLYVPYLINKSWKSTRKDLGLLELPTWTDIGLAPIGYFIYLLCSSLLTTLFKIFPWFDPSQNQDLGYQYSLLYGTNKVMALLSLVVVAPIVEEVIFRGFVYGKLKKIIYRDEKSQINKQRSSSANVKSRKRLSKTILRTEPVAIIAATLITSLTFAVLHWQWNVGVDVFAMSVVLCIIREITGSIYPGILVHMLKNGLAFFILSSTFSSIL